MDKFNRTRDVVIAFLIFASEALLGYVFCIWDAIAKRPKSMVGKVVVITGGASGIGRELAQMFANIGAKIALLDVNEKLNEQVANEINENAGFAVPFTVDVTKPDKMREISIRIQNHPGLGEPYLIVCNAGIMHVKSILEQSDEDIRRTIDVNLLGYFWTIRAFLPRLLEKNAGHIAAVASISSYFGNTNMSSYSASKFGIRGLMESLEWELVDAGKSGIKVTTVYPCFTYTPLLNNVIFRSRFLRYYSVEQTAKVIVDAILREKTDVYCTMMESLWCNVFKSITPQHVKVTVKRLLDVRVSTKSK